MIFPSTTSEEKNENFEDSELKEIVEQDNAIKETVSEIAISCYTEEPNIDYDAEKYDSPTLSYSVLQFIDKYKGLIPSVRGGNLTHPIDSTIWPDFRVFAPNPTLPYNNQHLQHEEYDTHQLCIYFWVPDVFWNKFVPRLKCPKCRLDSNVSSNGWNPKGPRRVKGYLGDALIVSKRYKCKSCKLSFMGYDPKVICLLPDFIAKQLPIRLTQRTAVQQVVASDQSIGIPHSCIASTLQLYPKYSQQIYQNTSFIYRPVSTFSEKKLFIQLIEICGHDYEKMAHLWNEKVLTLLKNSISSKTNNWDQIFFKKASQLKCYGKTFLSLVSNVSSFNKSKEQTKCHALTYVSLPGLDIKKAFISGKVRISQLSRPSSKGCNQKKMNQEQKKCVLTTSKINRKRKSRDGCCRVCKKCGQPKKGHPRSRCND